MPPRQKNHLPPVHRQRGAVLMLLLLLVSVGALAVFVSGLNRAAQQLERGRITNEALAQAKEALIGYAATYRDTHLNSVSGYLPCPDTNNDGVAETSCGAKDVSAIGRLPWKTLGLPPLRDSSGECLWYAISGRFKNNPKTDVLNWDTPGQFNVQDAAGVALAGGAAAVVLSPRETIGSQDRTAPGGGAECGGNTTIVAYLDGSDPIYAGAVPSANAISVLSLSTVSSVKNGTNNDWGIWISTNEIFDRIKRRSDFVTDVANMLNDIRDQASKTTSCTASSIKNPKPGIVEPDVLLKNIGFAPDISQSCIVSDAARRKVVFDNWRTNVLYAVCSGGTACLTVNGDANCAAAAIFSGEKVSGKLRPSSKASDYLEGANYSAFTSASTILGGTGPYSYKSSSADIALCIPPAPSSCTANSAILLSKVNGSGNDCKSGSTVLQSCIDAASQLASCSCSADAQAFITPPCINNLNPSACQAAISHLQACSS